MADLQDKYVIYRISRGREEYWKGDFSGKKRLFPLVTTQVRRAHLVDSARTAYDMVRRYPIMQQFRVGLADRRKADMMRRQRYGSA